MVVDAAGHTRAVAQAADGRDAAGCGRRHVDELRLGEARVDARDARLDALPGADAPVDEHDGATLGAQDARAAVGDRFDSAGEEGAGVHGGEREEVRDGRWEGFRPDYPIPQPLGPAAILILTFGGFAE